MIQDELPLDDAPSSAVLICDTCLAAWLRPRLGNRDSPEQLRDRAVSVGWDIQPTSDTCPVCSRRRERLHRKEIETQ